MKKLDYEKLRSDLVDFFGKLYVNGHPMAVVYMVRVTKADEKRLVYIAKKVGMNVKKYTVKKT